MSWWLVWFSRRGPASYVSHLDTARALQRTVKRAGVVPALTQGMRPRPRISVVVPLPVGVAAHDELMVMEIDDDRTVLTSRQALTALRAAGAGGLRVESLQVVEKRPRPVALEASYRCRVAASPESVATAVGELQAAAEVPVERVSPKGRKTLDLKEYLIWLRSSPTDDGVEVEFALHITAQGTMRPAEVVAALVDRLDPGATVADLERLRVSFAGLPEAARERGRDA